MTTLLVLVVVGIAASLIAQFWTEVLWFDSVQKRSVFLTELGAKVLLGVIGGLLTAGIVGSSLYIAYRTRPIYAPTSTNQDALERYRAAVEPLRRLAFIGIPLVIGLLSGLGAAGQWETYLLFRNSQPFGKTDPQFGMDVGFYVFTLPWLTFVVAFLSMALIIGVIVAAFTTTSSAACSSRPGPAAPRRPPACTCRSSSRRSSWSERRATGWSATR